MDRRRPPVHVRAKLDFEYQVKQQSIELLEVRPMRDKPQEILKRPFAKATFVRLQNLWKIYWMRGNLQWHPYDPATVRTVDEFFKHAGEDRLGCFLG